MVSLLPLSSLSLETLAWSLQIGEESVSRACWVPQSPSYSEDSWGWVPAYRVLGILVLWPGPCCGQAPWVVLTSPERADCPQSHGARSPLAQAITQGGQAGTGHGAMLTALFIQGFPAAPGHPARSACLFRPLFLEAPSGSLGVVGRCLSFRGGGLSPLHQAPAEN